LKVETVDFVSVPTRDVGRAGALYRELPGPPGSEYTPGEVAAPSVTLSVRCPRGATHESAVCHTGFFEDPDGNRLILHRRYAPRG
jgi:hypothetical protein